MNKVNDFVLNIATVNGSGSQTANAILLKTLFRMGIPVGGKNIFPSNIQGLPTWFWIRAHHKGYTGRKALADLVVNVNPATQKQDLTTLRQGGFYFSADVMSPEVKALRSDIHFVEFPMKALIDGASVPPKLKKLVSNMIYVGILAELLKLDRGILNEVISDQLGGKATAVEPNQKALDVGIHYAQESLGHLKLDFVAERKEVTQKQIILDGNTASAIGLMAGGCSFISWYPITPSTSVVEQFSKLAAKHRIDESGKKKYAVVQAEDELAAFTMVLGAGWAGARAMTATSGPGLSLMAEAAGYAYYTEIPTVIWDVQRVGPSTGMPTRTAQGDLLFAANLSHGDKKHILLMPGNLQECYEDGQNCFDLAEKFQQLVIVLSDLDLGMNLWATKEFEVLQKPYDRGYILDSKKPQDYDSYVRYADFDQKGIPRRTLIGNEMPKAAYFTRGSGHNLKAVYTEDPVEYQLLMDRLNKKFETAKTAVPRPLLTHGDGQQKLGLLCYGSTDAILNETVDEITSRGQKVDVLRVRAFPFTTEVAQFLKSHQTVFVIDQNRDAQMRLLLSQEFPELAGKLRSIRHYDGSPITAETVVAQFFQGLTEAKGEAHVHN